QEDRRYLLLETRLRAAEHSRKAQHKDGCELSKPSSASRPEEGPVNQPVRELRDFLTSPPPKLRRGMLKNRWVVKRICIFIGSPASDGQSDHFYLNKSNVQSAQSG
ncbi:hypothetical protein FOZ62_030356, partial [Perkinsus olseni]